MIDMPPKDNLIRVYMANYKEMSKRILQRKFGNKWGLAYGRALNQARWFYKSNQQITEYVTGEMNVERLAYNLIVNTGVSTILELKNLYYKNYGKIGMFEADLARLMPLYSGFSSVRDIIDDYIAGRINKEELNRLLKQFRNTPEYVQGSD